MKKITKTHPWCSRLASWAIALTCMAFMSTTAYAQNLCSSPGTLTVGAGCTQGTTVGATFSALEPNPSTGTNGCWQSAPSSTVWYSFTVAAADSGYYTISTDNGINNLGEDMQLALYLSTSGCTFDVAFNDSIGFYCNEDLDNPDNSNTLAAQITAKLYAGTYYVQVDQFGAGQGDFCISLTKNVKPSNDLVTSPEPITSLITGISATAPAATATYIYNAPGINPVADDAPTKDSLVSAGINTAENCNGSTAGASTYNGVWFNFTTTATSPATYLNIFPSNGANYYVATLFSGTPTLSAGAITGLTYLACSAGDNGLVNNGGNYATSPNNNNEDKANTNINGHPRLDLSELAAGTYHVLVNQYSRVLIDTGSGAGTVAAPSDGIINLVIEAAPANGESIDTLTADACNNALEIGCADAIANYSTTLSGLTNAGLSGDITVVQNGRTPTSKANEADDFVFNGGTGTFQENCQLPNFIGAALERFNSNSGVYKFTLNGATSTSTAIPDTLLSLTVSDTLIVIDTITVINPLGPIEVVIVDTIINVLPAAPCAADVRITLDNITNKGVNGGLAEIFIIPADNCAGSAVAVMGAETTSNDDQCLSIATSAGSLPPGTYYIWVDGGDGQVLTYDLTLDVNYFVPGTIVGCGVTCGSPKTATVRTIKAPGFLLAGIRPMPVSNSMFVDFKLDNTAPVTLNIYDISGRLVLSQQTGGTNGMNSLEVETSTLPEGMYIVNLLSGGQNIRSKFTKVANN